MAIRGDIVNFTYASGRVDTQNPDGTVTAKVGYVTRPAIVIAERATDVLDLHVFAESWEPGSYPGAFPNGDCCVFGVLKGPAAPDTRKGQRVDPTAQPGQPGTWS